MLSPEALDGGGVVNPGFDVWRFPFARVSWLEWAVVRRVKLDTELGDGTLLEGIGDYPGMEIYQAAQRILASVRERGYWGVGYW